MHGAPTCFAMVSRAYGILLGCALVPIESWGWSCALRQSSRALPLLVSQVRGSLSPGCVLRRDLVLQARRS